MFKNGEGVNCAMCIAKILCSHIWKYVEKAHQKINTRGCRPDTAIARSCTCKVCEYYKFLQKRFLNYNKPENPFQNYDLAKKTIRSTKEIFQYKNILIQPSEVQKPETGQKTGSRIKFVFSTNVAEFNQKFDGSIKFTIN